jgi:hypothetical protein
MNDDIKNPGSAFGESIGAHMEFVLNKYLEVVAETYNCVLVSKGKSDPKTLRAKKLLLYDEVGTAYNIDAVVANESFQPLILIEYKYIRYKKHNRDKGSWICYAHNSLRRQYSSVRSSIAILAGNWSLTSLAMMRSRDVNVFLIPFSLIVDLLAEFNIRFDWGEKERDIAIESWLKYEALAKRDKIQIAERMIKNVKVPLQEMIARTLDDTIERVADKVAVEVHTNIGELRRFDFTSIDEALSFLENFSFEEVFDTSTSPALWQKVVQTDDEE